MNTTQKFFFVKLDNVRYGPKENFTKICQIKWNWIRSVKFEIVWIDFEVTFSVCCHTKILLPWQHDVTTSPLYTPHLLWVYRHDNPRAMLGEHSKRLWITSGGCHGNCNLGNCKFTQKEFWDFNGIQTHSLCVSAAVLYQLSYEDPCIGSRPICWVHLNPWKKWSIGYLNFVNCGNTSYFKWRFDCHAVLYENFTGTQCLEIQGARDMRFMKKLTQDFLLAQEQMCDVRGYWALLEHSFTQKTLGICQKTIMLLK